MIEEYNKFTCNECKKEELLLKKLGYPYDKGWRRIHNMMGKVSRAKGEPGLFEIKEVDLCSTECETTHLQVYMDNATPKPVEQPCKKEKEKKTENNVDKALESMEKI